MASATSSERGHLHEEDNDDDWVDDDALDGLATTHRSRNPLAAVIRFRAQKKMARGPNIRATQRKKQASKAKRERAVAEDILKHHASRDAEAEELAEAHNMDVKEVKRRMMAGTKYKQVFNTTLYQALGTEYK
jgi:methylphosphotriester-DNA--protein-cysteine methyltransferase